MDEGGHRAAPAERDPIEAIVAAEHADRWRVASAPAAARRELRCLELVATLEGVAIEGAPAHEALTPEPAAVLGSPLRTSLRARRAVETWG